MTVAALSLWPLLPFSARSRSAVKKGNKDKEHPFLSVIRRDRVFLAESVRSYGEPLRPIVERVNTALSDLFWLRFLEGPHAQKQRPVSWPSVSYPPGLPFLGILIADLEALKNYVDYIHLLFLVLTMPLPEFYDPEMVESYFSFRPHILAFRIVEVLSSFSFAAIRFQLIKVFKSNRLDVNEISSWGGSEYLVGQFLKEALLSLGPTFVKVGQSLSTRPDIIGSEISRALSELHDKIPPFPRAVAMKIIEQELGGPVENYYTYLSEEPVAAASFGQVYQGRTLDGCTVAIKVQRPNMLHSVVRDIYILRLGLDILRKVAKRKSDLRLYADELGKGFVGELDYKIEAANASEFLDAHSQYSFMSVPKVLGHLTRKRVLTMEWMVGESPNTLLLQARGSTHEGQLTRIHKLESKRKLLDLVSKGVEATLVQLLETGLLHADPHPGNLRYTPEGCIGFLDFGLLCRMKKEHQIAMLASIIHIVNGDWGALVYDLTSMDVVRPGTNLRSVTMDFVDALGEVNYIDGIPDIKFSLVLGKILSIALKYQFHMPPYYTLVLRSLASLEGLAVAADQKFQTFQAAYPYVVKKLLYDNSKAARRILYSVVFNNRREIQWKKILLFLKIGSFHSVRSNMTIATNMTEYRKSEQDIIPVLNFVSSLLLSEDGIVLRRLMMTANAISLTRTMISKDATLFRRQISMFVADVIYRWMHKVILGKEDSSQNDGAMPEVNGKQTKNLSLSSPSPYLYNMLRDRRIKVIFYSKLSQVRKHPILMLRACWSCFTVLVMAFMIALHKFMSHCFEGFLDSLSFVPKPVAVSL